MFSRTLTSSLCGLALTASLAGLPTPPASATTLQFVLNSSPLVGTSAQLAFDLTNGDSLASNTAILTAFSTDGSLGTASPASGVTGTLPGDVTLTDMPASVVTELLQPITLGHTLSFTLTLTEERVGGPLPDQFALFLLDASGNSLFDTSDPDTGANALFSIDITGTSTGDPHVYSATNSTVSWSLTSTAIPAPSALLLFSLGLCCLAGFRRTQ